MEGLAHIPSESPRHGAGVAREILDQRSTAQYSSRPGDGRNTPRKPTPLQVSEPPGMAEKSNVQTPSKSPKSPPTMRTASEAMQYSPRSPRANLASAFPEPKSPRERLEEFLATEDPQINGNIPPREGRALRNATASPTKSQSYAQLRNASSPLPDLRPSGHSSPPSPRTTASPQLTPSALRPGLNQMPRTSSIDTAISTISMQHMAATGHAHKSSTDSISSNMPDISNLIAAAGSPEAVIYHLLKEKARSAEQSSQLWKLVDKQRSLLLGLNNDLERATEDKERYRKKYKDLLDRPAPLAPGAAKLAAAQPQRAVSGSPANSDASVELPMQRQESDPTIPHSVPENGVSFSQPPVATDTGDRDIPSPLVTKGAMAGANDWPKSESPKASGSGHSHTKTSSSDVNILGAFTATREIAPLQTRDLGNSISQASPTGPGSQPSSGTKPTMSPTSSFTAKRSVTSPSKALNTPRMILTESTPISPDLDRMTPPRKLPPAPLNLGHAKKESLSQQYGPEDHSDSDYEDAEVDELPSLERGRKKTREDDDRERKVAQSKEKEDRSRSKKEKGSKARSGSSKSKSKEGEAQRPHVIPMPPSIKALAPEASAAGMNSFLSGPSSLAGILQPQEPQKEYNITERTIPLMPMSPGLPLSPRPTDRPTNQPPPTPRLPRDGAGPSSMISPPLSPRNNFVGLPLSPRAPRQAIPLPPHTPMSMAPGSPMPPNAEPRKESIASAESSESSVKQDTASSYTQVESENAVPAYQSSEQPRSRGVFKGFISESYPGLLIPPNALPSIKIKVVSSRLKPSRNSLVLKNTDDEPVFTLGVSARYDRQDLWQVEKPILSLQQLDQQLRQSPGFSVRLPERSLFSGHAPAKIDARRVALENYFEAVLDTQLDEKAAVALCNYLSTHVSEPAAKEVNGVPSATNSDSGSRKGSDGRLKKSGYLTKRGKNFGGWKARYFVLDKPVLEYYEAPGGKGGPLGQIRLHNAQIGKQSPKSNASPSRGGDDGDGQYRHAFLIREPKRKDANAFMDHVLCAENDAERDAWVAALLCYVDGSVGSETDTKARPALNRNGSGDQAIVAPTKKTLLKNEAPLEDSPESENFDSLQAVPYEETRAAQAPLVAVTPDLRSTETPSPTTVGSASNGPARASSAQAKAISGPQNGGKIENLGAWGNKPMASPLLVQPKEQKKRGLWGFRGDNKNEHLGSHPNNSNLALTQKEQEYQEHATNVKAQFGAPLAEAVEYCAPRGIDVCLPSVVYRCLEYLEVKNAAGEEGIFRMSGSNNLIKHLRHRFNTEGDYDFLGEGEPYCDVHAVASLLKLYLRELPSMILTRELHMQFLSVLDIKEDTKKVAAYNVLVHRLPKANYFLIRALSQYLISIVNASDVNKMGIRNVCIVFSPTLNIPTPVFGMFLSAFDDIFEETAVDPKSVPALEATQSSSDALTPEDIRSPRKQMFSEIPTPSYNQESFASNSMNSMLMHDVNGNNSTNYHAKGLANDRATNNDTGFIPMQPAYESPGPVSMPYTQTQTPGSVTVPGPEYAVARPRNLAPGGSNKARRRESSMLLMNAGSRKSSLPQMRSSDAETMQEESGSY